MNAIGNRCPVGSLAVRSGKYKHAPCLRMALFEKDSTLLPCASKYCANQGGDWVFTGGKRRSAKFYVLESALYSCPGNRSSF